MPVATLVNVTLLPVHAIVLTGWVVMLTGSFTVKVAELEFKPPGMQLGRTTLYRLLFREDVAFSIKAGEVAPGTLAQVTPASVLTCHW